MAVMPTHHFDGDNALGRVQNVSARNRSPSGRSWRQTAGSPRQRCRSSSVRAYTVRGTWDEGANRCALYLTPSGGSGRVLGSTTTTASCTWGAWPMFPKTSGSMKPTSLASLGVPTGSGLPVRAGATDDCCCRCQWNAIRTGQCWKRTAAQASLPQWTPKLAVRTSSSVTDRWSGAAARLPRPSQGRAAGPQSRTRQRRRTNNRRQASGRS